MRLVLAALFSSIPACAHPARGVAVHGLIRVPRALVRSALHLAALISLTACRPSVSAPIHFSVAPAPNQLEVQSRHRLTLELGIGFDGELEAQRWAQQSSTRVRVERREEDVVVRWLEQALREGDVETVEPSQALSEAQRVAAQQWARAIEPDALQVALCSTAVRPGARMEALDDALRVLASRALGSGAEVAAASMQLTAATDGVAVFSASLQARTVRETAVMSYDLTGTLTVSRVGALPLSVSLEGPVSIDVPQAGEAPAVHGVGRFQVERRVRVVEPGLPALAER
jgi:hypothetical protein